MESRRMGTTIVLSIAIVTISTLCSTNVMAQSSSDCTSVIVSMSPCLNYITGNSSTPSSSCCSQLASVVKSEPQCLCQVLAGGASSLGVAVNQTRALALPGACNVQTPPVSRCNSGSSPAESPSTSDSSSGSNGSKSTPTTTNTTTSSGTSDGNTIKMTTFSMSFVVLLAASYYAFTL